MIVAATSGSALWYLARGTGLVSLVLLTAVMVLGITEAQRWAADGWPRFVVAALHRNMSLLVVAFLCVHIATAELDTFVHIGWIAAVVPFTSSYRPVWLGLGALAFDLLVALVVTSLLRNRLGYRAWRFVHWAAYASWPIAFVHGLGTGSDGQVGWVQLIDLACLGAVLAAVGWRLAVGWERAPGRRAVGAVASAAVVVGVVGWGVTGPARPGWARKAGTPATEQVAGASPSGRSGTSDPTGRAGAASSLTPPFTATFSGTENATEGASTTTVTIAGALSGGADGSLKIVLKGDAVDGGGVRLSSSTVTMGPTGEQAAYTGSVRSLRGGHLVIAMTSASGSPITVTVDLTIDEDHGTATGDVSATAGG